MQPRTSLIPEILKTATTVATTTYNAASTVASGMYQSATTLAVAVSQHAAPATNDSDATTSPPAPVDDNAHAKKKKRETTSYADNMTISISLKNETKKTLIEPSSLAGALFQSARKLAYGLKAPKYIDERIDICAELTALETARQAEMSKEAPDLDIVDKLELHRVELVKEQIIEHASRRMDLFFYLMIAIYKTGVTVDKGKTEKQHGIGNNPRGTEACHSSLFPNITLRYEKNDKPANSVFSLASMFSLFSRKRKMPSGPCELLKGKYLIEALNATVELPAIVNDFDGHLEGRFDRSPYTNNCIDILNKVSKGEIDPVQGLNDLYQVMNVFFNAFKVKHLGLTKIEYGSAYQKIWEYEREGTFSGTDMQTLTASKAYTNMMLKMNSYKDIWSYDHYFKQLQNEMVMAKVEKMGNQKKLKK